jgi:hypothetical protein
MAGDTGAAMSETHWAAGVLDAAAEVKVRRRKDATRVRKIISIVVEVRLLEEEVAERLQRLCGGNILALGRGSRLTFEDYHGPGALRPITENMTSPQRERVLAAVELMDLLALRRAKVEVPGMEVRVRALEMLLDKGVVS